MKLPETLLSKLAVGGLSLALTVGCTAQADNNTQPAPNNTPKTKQTSPQEPVAEPVAKPVAQPTKPLEAKEEKNCWDPAVKNGQLKNNNFDACPGCGRG